MPFVNENTNRRPMRRVQPVDELQTLEILNRVDFFSRFTREEKIMLTGFYSHFYACEPEQSIIGEGERDNSFYILLSGSARVTKNRSPHTIALLGPGDCFGEMSFITGCQRTSNVITQKLSIVFEIDHPTLNVLSSGIREKIKDEIIKKMVTRLDEMNNKLLDYLDNKPKKIIKKGA